MVLIKLRKFPWTLVVATLAWLAPASLDSLPQEPHLGPGRDEKGTDEKVFISHIMPPGEGLIDDAFVDRWEKEIDDALAKEPDIKFVVFRINSPGVADGDMAPVERMAKRIHRLRVVTVAHVDSGHRASNGAALVAIACKRLAMGQTAEIGYLKGASTGIPDDERPAAHKARSLFAHEATLKAKLDTSLAKALCSTRHATVYSVSYDTQVGDNMVSKTEIMGEELLEERKELQFGTKNLKTTVVSKAGERLTLSGTLAREYDLADVVLASAFDQGGRSDLLRELRIHVGKQNIIDEKRGPLEAKSRHARGIVNFLNRPFVRFILLLCAFLGLVLEIKMPGTFIPIACSAVCFLLLFIGGSFPAYEVTGVNVPTTSAFEIVFFVVGMGLVVVELFLLPGTIIFGLLGMAMMLVSLVLAMSPPADVAGTPTMTFRASVWILVAALGAGFGLFLLLLRFLPRSNMFNRSGLITTASIQGTPTANSIVEAQERNAGLLGTAGVALTPLRPAGKVEINGRVLDVIAEGEFIESGETVEIIDVSVFRAVVKRRGEANTHGRPLH